MGPGQPYAKPCDAIAKASPGDTIEVDAAGNYAGDTCGWSTDNLTVTGVNGRAKIDATGVAVAETKGIFVIHAPNATIENFELSGAAISAGNGNNGAGIRHQGLNLTVRNCFFHDNQDGILGGPIDGSGNTANGQGTVLVESSEFAHNGAGDGFSHNMYIGMYAAFTLQYSYSHGAVVGHLVKSRAYTSLIQYNRITDETGTTASYEVDLPSAGTAYVIGNVIEQSATSQNPSIISFGEESGSLDPTTSLFVVNNSVINDLGSGTFVTVGGSITTPATLIDNVWIGAGTDTNQASAVKKTNFAAPLASALFADQAGYDLHLVAAAAALIDKGTAPGTNGSQSLSPVFEYVHPLSSVSRVVVGSAIDIGAYEYGNPADAGTSGGVDGGTGGGDAGGPPPGDASTTTHTDSGAVADAGSNGEAPGGSTKSSGGCGCVAAGAEPTATVGAFASLVALALGVARRRRRISRPWRTSGGRRR